jgi:hypothetical protein
MYRIEIQYVIHTVYRNFLLEQVELATISLKLMVSYRNKSSRAQTRLR